MPHSSYSSNSTQSAGCVKLSSGGSGLLSFESGRSIGSRQSGFSHRSSGSRVVTMDSGQSSESSQYTFCWKHSIKGLDPDCQQMSTFIGRCRPKDVDKFNFLNAKIVVHL